MGKGLGNRFLDDLRHADALVHVVDVSGTTDAEGTSPCGSMTQKKDLRSTRLILCRQGNSRVRSESRHSMASLRDCTVDTRQPNGKMVTNTRRTIFSSV